MIKYTLPLFLFFFILNACAPTIPQKIKGTWQMGQVYDNSTNVTDQHNPKADRWITFFKDGSFKSGGAPFGKNEGKWIFYEADKVLYLDSNAGAEDDSYWVLQIKQSEMNWSGARSSFTERFRINFSKR